MNYTSIEQSKRLLEHGLSPDTADMFYCYRMNTETKEWSYEDEPYINGKEFHIDITDIPCWSVGALKDKLEK